MSNKPRCIPPPPWVWPSGLVAAGVCKFWVGYGMIATITPPLDDYALAADTKDRQ